MNKKLYAAAGMALSALLALSACTEKADTGSDAANGGDSAPIAVTSTDETCEVAAATTTSGATTFSVKNDGSKTTEFYLLGKDGLRIVGERENIAPGSSAELVVTLQPGDYFTACKPGMRGVNVGEAAFTVTGEKIERITAAMWPFVLAEVAVLFLVAYWPGLTLSVPALMGL